MDRREFLGGALAASFCSGVPGTLNAQTRGYTIDTYPYSEDPVFIPRFGIWRDVHMDVSLLHPETGAPSIGFYASLDRYHGEPFGFAWKNTYRKYMRGRSVHDPDRGTMIQIVNHIRTHAVTAEQFAQAYHIAKEAWDNNRSLRVAAKATQNGHDLQFG